MGTRRSLGIAGSFLLVAGAFAPVLRVPAIGSLDCFHNATAHGVLICALAGVSLILVVTGACQYLFATALGALGISTFSFVGTMNRMSELADRARQTNTPFEVLSLGASLEWGWVVLALGIGLLLWSAAVSSAVPARLCQFCAEPAKWEAVVCRYCCKEIGVATRPEASSAGPNARRVVFVSLAVTAFCIGALWLAPWIALCLEPLPGQPPVVKTAGSLSPLSSRLSTHFWNAAVWR